MALENTKTQDNDGRCGGTKNDARATVMLDATAPRTTLGKMTCSCVANAIGLVRVGSGVHKGMRKQCLGSIYSKVVGNRRDFKKIFRLFHRAGEPKGRGPRRALR